MIDEIIKIEREKLRLLGYDSIVGTHNIFVSSAAVSHNIGNDIYLLVGIHLSGDDVVSNRNIVSIISASNAIDFKQQEINTLGITINKTFRNYLTIRTRDESGYKFKETSADDKDFDPDVPLDAPYRLDFVKITPVKLM
jgi:hypothetical protein